MRKNLNNSSTKTVAKATKTTRANSGQQKSAQMSEITSKSPKAAKRKIGCDDQLSSKQKKPRGTPKSKDKKSNDEGDKPIVCSVKSLIDSIRRGKGKNKSKEMQIQPESNVTNPGRSSSNPLQNVKADKTTSATEEDSMENLESFSQLESSMSEHDGVFLDVNAAAEDEYPEEEVHHTSDSSMDKHHQGDVSDPEEVTFLHISQSEKETKDELDLDRLYASDPKVRQWLDQKLKREREKGKKKGTINKNQMSNMSRVVKSPSDTTIYAPTLQCIMGTPNSRTEERIRTEKNTPTGGIVSTNQISQFLERVRKETSKSQETETEVTDDEKESEKEKSKD